MKQNKKAVIVIIIVLMIFTIIVLLLTNNTNNNENLNDNNINSDNTSIAHIKINTLENDTIFFTLQRIINDYYDILKENDANKLYNILAQNYIYNNNINKNNILNVLENEYEDTSYIAKNIQYIEGEHITYYLINGYLLNQIIITEELQYENNVNYMIITKDNTYAIYPLHEISIDEFLEEYDFKNNEFVNSTNTYTNINILEENKLTTYINEFLTLMFVDTNKAYNMLSDESINLYKTLDNFNQRLYNIYQSISPVVFSYSTTETDEYTEYNIIDNNSNRITIYEYNTMNYRINIDFY